VVGCARFVQIRLCRKPSAERGCLPEKSALAGLNGGDAVWGGARVLPSRLFELFRGLLWFAPMQPILCLPGRWFDQAHPAGAGEAGQEGQAPGVPVGVWYLSLRFSDGDPLHLPQRQVGRAEGGRAHRV